MAVISDSEKNRLILRAMVSMALADKRVEASEIRKIRTIYKEITKEEIAFEDILSIARDLAASGMDICPEIARAAGEMNAGIKEAIIQAAYLVLLADGYVAAEERKRLIDLAAALGMSEIHYKAVLEDLSP